MSEEARKPGRGLEHASLTERIIGAAIEVHRTLGPGFLESVYEAALVVELRERGLDFDPQRVVPILYRQVEVGRHRLDLVIEDQIVVELKAIKAIENIHFAIVKSYLCATGLKHALILNFQATTLEINRVRHP